MDSNACCSPVMTHTVTSERFSTYRDCVGTEFHVDQFLAMEVLYPLNNFSQQPRYLVAQVGKCRASVPAKTLEMLRENESWDFRVGMMNPKELCNV